MPTLGLGRSRLLTTISKMWRGATSGERAKSGGKDGERSSEGQGTVSSSGSLLDASGTTGHLAGRPCGTNISEAMANIEILSDLSVKRVFRTVYLSVLVATGLLIALFGMKMTGQYDLLSQIRPVVVLNAVVAAYDLALLTVCLAWLSWRLLAVRKAGLKWSERNGRALALFFLQLASVYAFSIFFLAPNLYFLSKGSGYYDTAIDLFGGARWTAFNSLLALFVVQARSYNLWVDNLGHPQGQLEDATYLDAPWRAHWYIGLYWAIFETDIVLTVFNVFSHAVQEGANEEVPGLDNCVPSRRTKVLAFVFILLSLGYCGMFLYFMHRAFVKFAKKSYMQYRWPNIAARLAFRNLGVIMLFGVLSFSLMWFTRMASCMSYATSWMGFTPMHLTLTMFMAVRTWLTMPVSPACQRQARALGTEAHWLEKERVWSRKDRESEANGEHKLLFCFETAIKLVYWCEFIYEYGSGTKVAKPPFSMDTALSLYNLTHFEYLHVREMDAHAIVAWSQTGTILVCFRGTYSTANVMADLKFWRMPHPPTRRQMLLGTCPMVHKGFLQSWTGGGFNEVVLGKIKEILGSPGFDQQNLRIYVTGHSLGGAMAVLAAHDISRDCGPSSHRLSCYTFGSPRVGNHSFAAYHDRTVPDTWHVINDLDTIPRMGKFWMLFKRAGQRVIINSRGDMIVSPMFLEFKLVSVIIGQTKVVHHRLTAYRKSLSAVALAQFHRYKALPGGRHAIQELLKKGDITTVLGITQRSASKLSSMSSKIWARHTEHLGAIAQGGQHSNKDGVATSGKARKCLATLWLGAFKLVPWGSRQDGGWGQGGSEDDEDADIEAVGLGTI